MCESIVLGPARFCAATQYRKDIVGLPQPYPVPAPAEQGRLVLGGTGGEAGGLNGGRWGVFLGGVRAEQEADQARSRVR